MYIAPGKGRKNPGVKILMSTERPYHFVCLSWEFYGPVNNEVMSSQSVNSGTEPRQALDLLSG